ncbi:MAG: hypothetical protein ACE5IP_08650 [Terriglobia bacterium]
MRVRMAGLLVLGFFLVAALVAQESAGGNPMTEAEFVQLVNAKVEVQEIIAQIRARGIAFNLTPELEEPLKKLKGGKELLRALVEPATLELSANVPGAQVSVDGEARDPISPDGRLVLTGLAPGRHLVHLQAAGYVGNREDVFLKPGGTHPMEIKLEESVTTRPGPLGIQVQVQAGTTEDAALVELEFVKSTGERVQRLKSLVQQYADSPMALLGYGLLQETYLEQNELDEALAAGKAVLERDPKNFNARIRQARAQLGKGELEATFDDIIRAQQLVQEVETASAPPGTEPEEWERQKTQQLTRARSDLGDISYKLFVGATQVPEAARKSALLERYLEVFPDSPYLESAYINLAFGAQQQGDAAGMLAWATRGLEVNPDQGVLMVMVADTLSEQGKELGRAQELCNRLLTMLEAEPEKLRPAGLPDEQWGPLQQIWGGTAHSALGQALLHQDTAQAPAEMAKTRQAIEEFKLASPLLKAQPTSYARNLYRMAFAYATRLGGRENMRQAERVLTELVQLGTPYAPPAQELLQKVRKALGGR